MISGDIVDNTIEQPDLENMNVVVGILLVCAVELEIRYEPQMTTNGLHRNFQFLRRHVGFLERGVPPISIAFGNPNIFRKSHESALLDLWRFLSSGDESGPWVFNHPTPISSTRVKLCSQSSINRARCHQL